MARFVYDTLLLIFGTSLLTEVTDFMKEIMNALNSIFENGVVNTAIYLFIVIAASILTVNVFMELLSRISQEMLTFEHLMLILIKYFIGMIILIYLPDIVQKLFEFAYALYSYASNSFDVTSTGVSISLFGKENWMDSYEVVKSDLEGTGLGKVKAVSDNIGLIFQLIIPFLVCKVSLFATLFLAASNSVTLTARAIFSPIGIVQCFDELKRSEGVRYLKKFLADGLVFAVTLGVLYGASLIHAAMFSGLMEELGNIGSIEEINKALSAMTIVKITVIQLAAVGGILKANAIANDMVGA